MSSSASAPTPKSFLGLLQRPDLICGLLVLATWMVYWPVAHAEFINYDDPDYVTENPRVQSGLSWAGVKWAFTSVHASNWHPLTWLSHMADTELFGSNSAGPHLVNLALHSLSTILLFLWLRQMTANHWPSAFVAALFALHPLHVESVAWISERKDVLSTVFGMLTLLAYASYVSHRACTPSRRFNKFYFVALAAFALGLMSKPMLVTLPFVMLLLDIWPLRRMALGTSQAWRPKLQLVIEKTPFFLLSIASSVVTTWAQKGAIQPLEYLPLTDRIANAFVAYATYLGKIFWPTNLAIPYLHPGHWPATTVSSAAALIVIFSILAFVMQKRPHIFTGWFWFVGTLVPVIGLVQVGTQSMADRYSYLPAVGIFILVIWSVCKQIELHQLPRIATALAGIIVIAICSIMTWQQAKVWENGETLFKHSAAVTKDNFIALGNVGGTLFKRGRLDEAMSYYQQSLAANPNYPDAMNSIGAVLASQNKPEAAEWFRKTLEIQPTHADALFNLGNSMERSGNPNDAAAYYTKALAIRPDNFEARNNLGNLFFKQRKMDDAIREYRAALEYHPNGPMIHKNLGEALAAKGRIDEAIAHYREALKSTNDASIHYAYGMTLAVKNNWAEAITHYAATLQLFPTNAEAHYNIGYAYRMQGNADKALFHLTEAVHLRPGLALAHYNLACVLAERGEKEKAIQQLREALRIQPDYEEARKKLSTLEGS